MIPSFLIRIILPSGVMAPLSFNQKLQRTSSDEFQTLSSSHHRASRKPARANPCLYFEELLMPTSKHVLVFGHPFAASGLKSIIKKALNVI